ncbi:hypothetical protein CHARACLAT_011184, partial [Characodon lateralis]|nr:hypothetical protein [Characodon lateralis]
CSATSSGLLQISQRTRHRKASSPVTSIALFQHMTTSRNLMGMDKIHCIRSARLILCMMRKLVTVRANRFWLLFFFY